MKLQVCHPCTVLARRTNALDVVFHIAICNGPCVDNAKDVIAAFDTVQHMLILGIFCIETVDHFTAFFS